MILTRVSLEQALAGLPDGRYLVDDLEIFSGIRVNDGGVYDEQSPHIANRTLKGWLRECGYDKSPTLSIYRVEKESTDEPG